MVFARTKLVIADDLLKPRNIIRLHYSGENPKRLYPYIKDLMLRVFTTVEGNLQEKTYAWSKKDTKEKFKVSLELIKDLDTFSYYRITTALEGEQEKNKGSVSLEITGELRTEYPQDTIWQRSLIYELLRMIWHRFFYHGKREEYLSEGRRLIRFYEEEIKSAFKLP